MLMKTFLWWVLGKMQELRLPLLVLLTVAVALPARREQMSVFVLLRKRKIVLMSVATVMIVTRII